MALNIAETRGRRLAADAQPVPPAEAGGAALVRAFAAALDADDFQAAAALLAPDCRYEAPGPAVLVGPEAIVASYRESSVKARAILDEIRYDSEVAQLGEPGLFRITFRDHLRKGERRHVFRSEQEISTEAGCIQRIVHHELPLERDSLAAFFSSAGIEWR